ncbi:MAG: NAD(P)H-dependent oxidoreductase [Polyangia bacterium]
MTQTHDPGAQSAVRLVALCGSLRKKSYNRALLDAAAELAPAHVSIERIEIGDFPLFDQDVLDEQGLPQPARRLCAAVAAADGLLVASPEYNYSVPGVLKNAIDWASRDRSMPFANKALGIVSASPGNLGGARMQYHLRQIAVFLNLHVLNRPEVLVSRAAEKFDAEGRLTDEETRKHLATFMQALAAFAQKLRAR